MAEAFTQLKGLQNIGESSLSQQIADNMIEFFNWGLIDKGAYFNVSVPTSGLYGGNKHKLRLVDDPRYTDGQVWETFRSNLVWETGVSPTNQPVQISGVYVGGTFQPISGVGPYKHHIDYPNGRIVFDTAISTSSEVTMEYSHKWVNVTKAEGVPWFREIQYGAGRVDHSHFSQTGSGDWSQLGQTRLQMPIVAVEVVPRRTFKGYQLGGGQWTYTDVLFHVISEDESDATKLMDVISLQNDSIIWLFDTNHIARSGIFPLDYRGMINDNALESGRYPDLVSPTGDGGHRWKRLRFSECVAQDIVQINPKLYIGAVRANTEVILTNI